MSKKGKPYFSAFFNLIDHKNKEVLKGSFFLNNTNDSQKFKQNSIGFDLVDSVDACNDYFANGNEITIGFKEFQTIINGMDKVTGIIKEHMTERKAWNSFRITKIHPNEGFDMYGDGDD